MTQIGRPESANPYNNIQLHRKVIDGQNKKTESAGDVLNKLAGYKDTASGVQFKDAKEHNKMGKDEFLRLLSTQLQNQDPLNPMDSQKFGGELAQFSQLEQLTNMNTSMQKMTDNTGTENKFYAASFIGKEVATNGTSVVLAEQGQEKPINFNLKNDAVYVKIRVLDEKGQTVRTIEKENVFKGPQQIMWDGMFADGYPASKGNYTFSVDAYDKAYQRTPVENKVFGVVSGVSFEDGETVLTVNNQKVYLRDVEQFRSPQENIPTQIKHAIESYNESGDGEG